MLELHDDKLVFSFPQLHPEAVMSLEFQRTLRIPDDGKTHFLPPGLGEFPLRHVDDFASRIPESWREHGGVMMPMFQSEATWINFHSHNRYPFLLKIAAGKINAVTGDKWEMQPKEQPQDYLVVPDQPWLDGFCVEKDVIRQFVAMPLGDGYTAEEQLTGVGVHGGVQVVVYPMKAEAWEKLKKIREREDSLSSNSIISCLFESQMGLAPGGKMKQQIHTDPHNFDVWDLDHMSRCFVHIANSIQWRAITGEAPPTIPPTAKQYTEAGLPWFDHYKPEAEVVGGSEGLRGLKTVGEIGEEKGEVPLPENEGVGGVIPKQLF